MRLALLLCLPALCLGWIAPQDPAPSEEPGTAILQTAIHLGNDDTPEWPEADAKPYAADYFVFVFEATQNKAEHALQITRRNVDDTWQLSLNGTPLGILPRGKDRSSVLIPVPPDTLRDGKNKLRVHIDRVGDDITFGPIRLLDRSFRDILKIAPVQVEVVDAATGLGIPARLTIVDEQQKFRPLYYPGQSKTPIRKGVAYTDANGRATLELGVGKIHIYATHGPEWSVAEQCYGTDPTAPNVVRLALKREVDTTGWLSADTHIHTLTFSGHGDASVEERVLSIAGEGLDIAISTDHNHHTDYSEHQYEADVRSDYRSVIGNEVTTKIGHFNAFPFAAGSPIPDHRIEDWGLLVQNIRANGAQVVILNHPRWPDRKRGPFGVSGLNPRTGIFADGLELPVDAFELFNSTTPETPWTELLQDWFGLLNAGSRVRGVGSSDSHSILDPVGQGRTWLRSSTDDPHAADIADICTAFREGNSSMGIGLFGTVEVQGVGPGEMAQPIDGMLDVQFHVAGASWATIEKAVVYLNGVAVATNDQIPATPSAAQSLHLSFSIPTPPHDAWLVCVAQGPRPAGPWWHSLFDDLTLVTNPVWIDVNGDGIYHSPAETAQRACSDVGKNPDGSPRLSDLEGILSNCDEAVAIQVSLETQRLWSHD